MYWILADFEPWYLLLNLTHFDNENVFLKAFKYNKQIQGTMTINDLNQNFHTNPSNKKYANYHNIKSDMKRF